MSIKPDRPAGFAIVELAVVIVVVGILASLVTMTYSGVQQRTRDARRVSDMKVITEALGIYLSKYGYYPALTSSGVPAGGGGWEVSSVDPPNFLKPLKNAGVLSAVPVDPINDSPDGVSGSSYRYYRYTAGNYGCDASRGDYYVLVVTKTESAAELDSTPGFSCAGRDWAGEGGWVTGGYTRY